jgi:hypothetical protein
MRFVSSTKLLSLIAVALLSVAAFAQDQKPGKPLAGYKSVVVEKATVEKNAATEEFPWRLRRSAAKERRRQPAKEEDL